MHISKRSKRDISERSKLYLETHGGERYRTESTAQTERQREKANRLGTHLVGVAWASRWEQERLCHQGLLHHTEKQSVPITAVTHETGAALLPDCGTEAAGLGFATTGATAEGRT